MNRRFFVLSLLAPGLAFSQAKFRKSAVGYRDEPYNGEDCWGCFYFVRGAPDAAPGACTIVEGEVSPRGWCDRFKARQT